MLETFVVLLLVALIVTCTKIAGHQRALRSVREAIEQRQPFLRKDAPGASGQEWDAFCDTANTLIGQIGDLEKTQTSQITQLDVTLGSLKEAVLVVDSYNHIMLANKSLQDIFPRATQAIDERLEVVLHSVEFLNYVEAVRKGIAQPHQEIEFAELNEIRWVEVTGTTIPALDGSDGQWVLFVLHNVTRQKALERVRKEFVANVSHELRTPLAVIKGYIETLVDGHDEMEPADRQRFLGTIQRHTERLNSLLEDLLTLSRLESVNPGLERESIELRPHIRAILDDYRNRPDTGGHQIVDELEPAIDRLLIDPLKLNQVLINLIDNALKYTPADTTIEVAAQLHAEEVEIRVSDNGPGIPAADLPHIFERFFRVEKGRSREKGGTGLGLSIVKHIVQLHGGQVRAESSLGHGVTFVLTFPASPNR